MGSLHILSGPAVPYEVDLTAVEPEEEAVEAGEEPPLPAEGEAPAEAPEEKAQPEARGEPEGEAEATAEDEAAKPTEATGKKPEEESEGAKK